MSRKPDADAKRFMLRMLSAPGFRRRCRHEVKCRNLVTHVGFQYDGKVTEGCEWHVSKWCRDGF
jgi:hypothetical protein